MSKIRIRVLISLWVLFIGQALKAQFPPAAGQVGSTAIRNDSNAIVAWATHCIVHRGPIDVSSPEGGSASYGSPEWAIGFAEGNPSQVVSLGDGGSATLTFEGLIYNGPGPDFVVFENGFSDEFLELAFVEVSSNGENFYRFPAISLTDTSLQIGPFGTLDPTKIHNLAGKYRAGYGTPFDLDDVSNIPGLDVNAITHVRIIDVIGCINTPFLTRDSQGHIINDPWPTPFPSSGFDLDGVGAIHLSANILSEIRGKNHLLYNARYRCISDNNYPSKFMQADIFTLTGNLLGTFKGEEGKICLPELPRGVYLVKVLLGNYTQILKIIEQ